MSDLEFQQTIIKREAQDKKDALDEFGANYTEAMNAIDRETDEKMHQASVDYMDALDADERPHQRLVDDGQQVDRVRP
jgi:hypothetical protein